jgi:hypothetical protein
MTRTHDGRHGDDCGPCRWGTVGIAAAATPTRRPQAVFHNDREKQWSKDHQAVRTLAKQGITPKHVDGAAELANRATSQENIERGIPA